MISSNRIRFPAASWYVGTADALPVASRSQDCVFAYYVLEHCVFPQRFLDDLLDKVKAGGRLLLVFQDVVVSKVFGSQAVGRDQDTAKEHLRHGRVFRSWLRFWDTHIRLPEALRSARQRIGSFPVNLKPRMS